MTPWPFDTVLIANRGEIALRILRSVQAQGLRAVVVHHALDRLSPAVAQADQAIELRGSSSGGGLPRRRRHSRRRACVGGRCDPSGLRIPVRERRIRPQGPGRRHPLHRTNARGHRPDGRQGTGARLRGPGRLSGGALGHRGRRSVQFQRAGPAGGVSAADQAGRRRRRQGDAHRQAVGTARRRDRARAQRGAALLRRWPPLRRALHREPPAHRGAGAGRRHRPGGASVRARVFGAAPLPEDRRRVALAGAGRRHPRSHLLGGRRVSPGVPAIATRAQSNSFSARASSTSSK
jgi:hypothetical protein